MEFMELEAGWRPSPRADVEILDEEYSATLSRASESRPGAPGSLASYPTPQNSTQASPSADAPCVWNDAAFWNCVRSIVLPGTLSKGAREG